VVRVPHIRSSLLCRKAGSERIFGSILGDHDWLSYWLMDPSIDEAAVDLLADDTNPAQRVGSKDWHLDSGGSMHISENKRKFMNFKPYANGMARRLRGFKGTIITAKRYGYLILNFRIHGGRIDTYGLPQYYYPCRHKMGFSNRGLSEEWYTLPFSCLDAPSKIAPLRPTFKWQTKNITETHNAERREVKHTIHAHEHSKRKPRQFRSEWQMSAAESSTHKVGNYSF
jgi:hypothetical protein